jgi:hypothetical protein
MKSSSPPFCRRRLSAPVVTSSESVQAYLPPARSVPVNRLQQAADFSPLQMRGAAPGVEHLLDGSHLT